MQNTNPVNGPSVAVEHVALDTALSPAILHTLKPTAAGKKNILAADGVCCITFTLYGDSSSFPISQSLFEFMKGHRPTNPEADVLFLRKRNRKGKGSSPRIVFFFTRFCNFISCFQKMKWKYKKF